MDRPKSELYRLLIPTLMTGAVELPDHPVLRSQLLAMERRVAKSGRESIDHPRGQRDDVANAVAGVVMMAQHAAQPTIAVLQSAPDHSWMDPYVDGRVRRSRGPEPETFHRVREARRQRQAQRIADALERPRDPNAETWIPPGV